MVEISYLGHSGVRIRGKRVTLVIDPPEGNILGIQTPKNVTADIVLLTQGQVAAHSNLAIVKPLNGEIFQISGPGEYEISQTEITGFAANSRGSCYSDSTKLTIYQIEIDEILLLFLGTIAKLQQNLVEQLSSVDVLFFPAGGKVSIDPGEADNVITSLEPAIVVPIHYQAGEKDGLGSLDNFLTQVGKIPIETLDKLQISKDRLPEEVKIVVLKTIGDRG